MMMMTTIVNKFPQFVRHSLVFFTCDIRVKIIFWCSYYYFIIIPFNRCQYWGIEKLNDLARFIQLVDFFAIDQIQEV